MNRGVKIAGAAVALGVVFVLGRTTVAEKSHGAEAHLSQDSQEVTEWTCSMHPQVRLPKPDKCPICAMDLVAVVNESDADDGDLPRLALSERSLALMSIQTAPVQRGEAYVELKLSGRIAVDETRKAIVSAWFSGRIERLYVDFVGTQVKEGEHLAEMYSPQLFGAQEEFLQALRSVERRSGDVTDGLVAAARTKLRLLGLSEKQIEALQEKEESSTHLTYYSPVAGTVLARMVSAGQYVDTGTPMYEIADLSQVWAILEAHESELKWLRYGQSVQIEAAAYPGEVFSGRIAYIQPEVDELRRTVRVRVNLPNAERKLKPGMLVTGLVKARIGSRGEVYDEFMVGKWISPMHPEVIKEGPGVCDVCGMALVPAESMGYFALSEKELEDPLLIPSSAPLLTGRRAVVYVRVPGAERPKFEARTVTLGQRVGNAYLVMSGLEEGELVVTNGQFKIDSELQIRGRPSMMAPRAEDSRGEIKHEPLSATVSESFSRSLIPLVGGYLKLVDLLAADDAVGAGEALKTMLNALRFIDSTHLSETVRPQWNDYYEKLETIIGGMMRSPTIEHHRDHLQALTDVVEAVYIHFGGGHLPPVNRALCPMVNGDQVGTWLQVGDLIANPYFGKIMLRCGEVVGPLDSRSLQK